MTHVKRCFSRIIRRILYGAGTEEFWRHRDKALAAKSALARKYHRWRYSRIAYKNGSSIPDAARIDGHLVMPHGMTGVFVSQGAVIGKNCTVFQQVTIGSNTVAGSKTFGAPTLGDDVYVGAGAKIIGGVHVGSRVRIGANCVVTQDVPDDCTVVLEHPRVIVRQPGGDNVFRSFGDAGK